MKLAAKRKQSMRNKKALEAKRFAHTVNQSIKFYFTRKFKYWSRTAKDQLVAYVSCTRSKVIKQYRRVLKFVTKIKKKTLLRLIHYRTKSNEKKRKKKNKQLFAVAIITSRELDSESGVEEPD